MKKVRFTLLIMLMIAGLTACSSFNGTSAQSATTEQISAKKVPIPDTVSDDSQVEAMDSSKQLAFLYGQHTAEEYCTGYAAVLNPDTGKPDDERDAFQVFNAGMEFDDRFSGQNSKLTAVSVLPYEFECYSSFADDLVYSTITYYSKTEKAIDTIMRQYGEEGLQRYLSYLHLPYAMLSFATEDGKSIQQYYLIQAEGNVLHLKPFHLDGSTLEITYPNPELQEDYQFHINTKDNRIMLMKDGISCSYMGYIEAEKTMYAGESDQSPADEVHRSFTISGYNADSDFPLSSILCSFGDLSEAFLTYKDTTKYAENVNIEFQGTTGLIISWLEKQIGKAGSVKKLLDNLRFFDCSSAINENGFLLLVNSQWFPFQMSEAEYDALTISQSLAAGLDASGLGDTQKAALIQNQQALADEISSAMENSDVDAHVDSASGAVSLDNSILFGFDDATLSDKGKVALDSFMDAYVPVISKAKKQGSIADIVVEGYTDPQGSYDYNMTLSEERAQSVVDYCTKKHPEIAEYITAKGCSYDKLVYNEDGTVNDEASRRVEFHFILDTDGIGQITED